MRLHEQAKHYKSKADSLETELDMIMEYVQSSKFNADQMVNTADIQLRVTEARNRIQRNYTDLEG